MNMSRLCIALLGLTLACADAPPAQSPVVPTASTAPAVAPSSDGDHAVSGLQTSPADDAAPLPDPWGRAKDIRSAVGGGHYAKGVAGGQKYMVKDARTGASVSVGIPLIVMDGGRPRAYPSSAHAGHVIFKSRSQGDEVLLDYSLRWDPAASRGDGSVGGFLVDDVVLLQRGDAPAAARFVRAGDWWRREPIEAPSPD